MPDGRVSRRANRAWRWRDCLAAWFAALLAIAPVIRPTLPIDLGASALRSEGSSSATEPGARLEPAQPVGFGILSRPSLVETAFGPAAAKSPLHRPGAADGWMVAADATDAPNEPTRVFHRSSVGTARTPTGPPF
jgi:hypothetical protein